MGSLLGEIRVQSSGLDSVEPGAVFVVACLLTPVVMQLEEGESAWMWKLAVLRTYALSAGLSNS